MDVSSAPDHLQATESSQTRKVSAQCRRGEWTEWPFSSTAYDPALENGSDILAALEQFEAEELSKQTTAVKHFAWSHESCTPSTEYLDLKHLALSLQDNPAISQRYYFINRFLKKSNVVQMPKGARRLQITSPALRLLASELNVPPAFVGALARFFQPAGRGSNYFKTSTDFLAHDHWYIIPIRVQVACAEDHRSQNTGPTSNNQMDPFHYLHLPDEKVDVRGSQIGIWVHSDLTHHRSTALVISLQDGRWSRVVEEPLNRMWEVLEYHSRVESHPDSFEIHLVYLTSTLRLWKNVLSSFNNQLLAYEKQLQDSIENPTKEQQNINNKLNKILHTMTAHLHRYGSELSNLSDIVDHVKQFHEAVNNLMVQTPISPPNTTTDDHQQKEKHLKPIPSKTETAITQIRSQLRDVTIFRKELQQKTQNILALLFNNIQVSNDKVMVENGIAMNKVLRASRAEAQMSMKLAQEMRNDSAAMKTIALLTAGFLPGTSFAALLSMPFFAQNEWMNNTSRVWIWIALTVPSTMVAFAFYHYWSRRHRSHMKKENESEMAEMGEFVDAVVSLHVGLNFHWALNVYTALHGTSSVIIQNTIISRTLESCVTTNSLLKTIKSKLLSMQRAASRSVSPVAYLISSVENKLPRAVGRLFPPAARVADPSTSRTMSLSYLSSFLRFQKRDTSPDKLFSRAEAEFPEKWRQDGWYLTTVAALIATRQQARVGELYQHLIEQSRFSPSAARQQLVRRLREAMIKCIILNGIPVVMEAFQSLAKVERPEDQDHSFTREGWQPDEANARRGMSVLETIYRDENDKIWTALGAHKDIPWISVSISYGLFLANHTVLDIQESEMVILPAIMCQNLRGPTQWHLRGCLRVGMTREEVDAIQKVIEMIAAFGGRDPIDVGRVWDVEE